jgi:uncharacterized SAM-binding protein YcdF (DUF218 family)
MKRAESASYDTMAAEPARPRRFVRVLLVALVFYFAGFALFTATLPHPHADQTQSADAIVALTGEAGRLGPAVALLESGHGKRLLISGVNRRLTRQRLKAIVHGGATFDCCTDLGFVALDTRGNAAETARWVDAHHYRSLIVVTASYHMPRSLLEFGAAMPGVELIAYPVAAEGSATQFWLNFRRLNGEYAKYLASLARVSVSHLVARA